MDIAKITELTEATLICGNEQYIQSVKRGFASDLMSDVLTLDSEGLLLITGLCNLQTIRTAEMAEINCILFVRGKKVTDEMKILASENAMTLLETDYSMFRTVGILYSNGLDSLY